MDLYGDLPPAEAEAQGGVIESWAKNSIKTVIEPAKPVEIKPVAIKKMPMMFKPRQATIKPPPSFISTSAVTSAIKKPKTIINEDIHKSSNTEIKTTENQNTSAYDDAITLNFDCEDPYDPNKPNDYIKWCEERLEIKRLAKVAQENTLHLLEAEKIRAQREKERAEAAEKGDFEKLQGMMSMGRGRGRGVVNLPAWMTDGSLAGTIQATERLQNSNNNNDSDTNIKLSDEVSSSNNVSIAGMRRSTVALKNPSSVLLIVNMVGKGEVDEALVRETATECSKYGPVKDCAVYEVKDPECPDEEVVRTFVHFERQDSAIIAFRDLNGRYFGGRKIEVRFFNVEKFNNRELAPENYF